VAQLGARERPVPMAFVGMEGYGTSGRWDELLGHFDLEQERIAREARALLVRKSGSPA